MFLKVQATHKKGILQLYITSMFRETILYQI